jgi:hypothetical protein
VTDRELEIVRENVIVASRIAINEVLEQIAMLLEGEIGNEQEAAERARMVRSLKARP